MIEPHQEKDRLVLFPLYWVRALLAWFREPERRIISDYLKVLIAVPVIMGVVAVLVMSLFAMEPRDVAWHKTQSYNSMYAEWQINHTQCPSSTKELAASTGKKEDKDPWGNDYLLSCPNQHEHDLDVCSNGPDEQPNTGDDICNWMPHCELCALESEAFSVR